MSRLLALLDLYCCAGGATKGYQDAGFYVLGVDIRPQRHYCGDAFIQADALEFAAKFGGDFDAIHASPPCQHYSSLNTKYRDEHPDLIGPTRLILQATGRPFVIENVENARRLMINPLMLCGSMFGLPIERHRYFEYSPNFIRVGWQDRLYCRHIKTPVLISGVTRRKGEHRRENSAQECREASGIDWMTRAELDEAIPPVYTQYIGRQLIETFR